MENSEFRQYGHKLIDWIADYYQNIESLPVKSQVSPKEIYNALPKKPTETPEDFDKILLDFDQIIMPGITHWQHPSFFAYFNANTSFPSILGELLTSAIGAQCMSWETSPAAAELEELMCDWIKGAFGLPANWHGVIQDTASTATLCALLMAREKHSNFMINKYGFHAGSKYIIYCSTEAHSSVEKGMKIAGYGSNQLRKIRVDEKFAMIPEVFERQIIDDLNEGLIPLCVISAIGTTSSHGIDPVRKISEIAMKYEMYHHVDAAHAGNATVLEECRWMIDGLELADSYVFNPHKWMFTNFDCSLFYVKQKEVLIRTFEILPEYLKTGRDSEVNNYRDWGIQLGRRFRALKLWFVLRSYGLEGIRAKFREHIELAKYFEEQLKANGNFEVMAPRPLNLVCFRIHPSNSTGKIELDDLNKKVKESINTEGKAYLTHTTLHGKYTLRVNIGQTNVDKRHVDALLKSFQGHGGS
jgi:aromatic-L-amino-acid/L-tryptophan decarboxylase